MSTITLLLLALAAPLAPAAQDPAPDPPGRPRPIAGMRALLSRSTIVFEGLPDAPHSLEVSLAFPDRARWFLLRPDPGEDRRVMRCVFGEAVYLLPHGKSESSRLEGSEADAVRLQVALRRALLLWPDGERWVMDGRVGRAALEGLGELEVALGDDGRPTTMSVKDLAGDAFEEARAIVWRDGPQERVWPAQLELWASGRRVWAETFAEVDVSLRFLDEYFLPPDRRTRERRSETLLRARRVELPARVVRREELPPGATWDTARRAAQASRPDACRALESVGGKLAEATGVALDDALQPAALLWFAEADVERLPDGWERLPPESAMTVHAADTGELGRGMAAALRALVLEQGLVPGRILGVRLLPPVAGRPGRVELAQAVSERR
jgi:hypothetical protein